MRASHHLLIAGTGRAGTSALVRLLSVCGLETTLKNGVKSHWSDSANAGAESLILREASMPYVIKSPWAYQFIEELLDRSDIVIDEVIIPIRRLSDAAMSRVINEFAHQNAPERGMTAYARTWGEFGLTAGGTLNSLEPLDQERILGRSLHKLVEVLEERGVKFQFLSFPRFVEDPPYAWSRLKDLFPEIRYPVFEAVYKTVINREEARVEREISESFDKVQIPQTSPATPRGLDVARMISLNREITMLREQLARGGLINPICHDPDEAPEGMSHGDAMIGEEGLQGWHWHTVRRPEAPHYGYQLAYSDTIDLTRSRRLADGAWTAWRIQHAPADVQPIE